MKRKSTALLTPTPAKKQAFQKKTTSVTKVQPKKAVKRKVTTAAPKKVKKAAPRKIAVAKKKTAPAKKKTPSKKKTTTTKKTTASTRKTLDKKTTKKKPAASNSKQTKKQATKKEPVKRVVKHPNDKLTPNPNIQLVSKDPMFEDKNEKSMPETGPYNLIRKAIRAVLTNDIPLLKRLIKNTKEVAHLFGKRSLSNDCNALQYAFKLNNKEAIILLTKEALNTGNENRRRELGSVNLTKSSTGRYNYASLGHATRALSMARGSREGNDAFTHDGTLSFSVHQRDLPDDLIAHANSYEPVETFLNSVGEQRAYMESRLLQKIGHLAKQGKHKVVGKLAKEAFERDGFGFNKLHHEVLTCSGPKALTPFRTVSIKKKPYDNFRVTPLHFACINPNPKMLEHLLAFCSDYFLTDSQGWSVIHYAAVCEGSGPLELVLARGAFVNSLTTMLQTPLMLAANTGRVQNMVLILKKLKKLSVVPLGDIDAKALEPINFKTRETYTALHMAALNGHSEACELLIDNGATIEAMLSASKNKVRPLMTACSHGHLATVKTLVGKGAIIEAKDKLKKTALIHAIINGHYPVACYLLKKGANPNARDSSGNTPIHYAAGYGWWHCIKLLILAGADPSALNDWKVPPLGIAFLKGQSDCADLLFNQPGVDVNFRDSDGWTLVMMTVDRLSEDRLEQLKYLLNDKKADATLTDADGWNALHHLMSSNLQYTYLKTEMIKIRTEAAKLLIKHGCDSSAKSNTGETPLNICVTVEPVKVELMQVLVEMGADIAFDITGNDGKNILHLIPPRIHKETNEEVKIFDLIFKKLTNSNSLGDLKEAAKVPDSDGFTPFLRLVEVYDNGTRNNAITLERFCKDVQKMIERFVNVAGADINYVIPEDEKQRHLKAKGTALHYIIQPFKIVGEQREYKDLISDTLKAFLRFKPDLDVRNKDGLTPLQLAVSFGSQAVGAVEMLIDAGANLNLPAMKKDEKDPKKLVEGDVPLIMAARSSQLPTVQKLLSKGASVKNVDSETKRNILHLVVCSDGSVVEIIKTVKELIKKGVDINNLDGKKRNALHLAVEKLQSNSPTDVVEYLLEAGADVFALDIYGRLPIHYAFVKFNQHTTTSQYDPIEVVSVLTSAMKGNGLRARDRWGQTVLHRAAIRGATISFSHIMEFGGDVDEKDNLGNTPMGFAVKGSHDSLAITLLQMDVNIIELITTTNPAFTSWKTLESSKNKLPWTLKRNKPVVPEETVSSSILKTVILSGLQGVLYLMIDKIQKKRLPKTPVVQAILEAGQVQLAHSLLKKRLKDEDLTKMVNEKKQNLLHVMMLSLDKKPSHEHMELAGELIKRGVKLSDKDVDGCLPLTYAIKWGDVDFCKFLFDAVKGDVKTLLKSPDKKGRESYCRFFRKWTEDLQDLWKLLAEYGMSPNYNYTLPIVDDGIGYESYAIKEKDEEGRSLWRVTALINAIVQSDYKQLKFFLQNNADVNVCDENGFTPLIHAVKKNEILLVKLLLNKDFEADAATEQQIAKKAASMGVLGAMAWDGRGKKPRTLNNDDDDDDDDDDMGTDDEDMDDDQDNEDDDQDDAKNKATSSQELLKKTSDVNIAAVDNDGQNVFHHLLLSSIYGTFENVEILKLLAKFVPKSVLSQKNVNGKTPLMLAVEARAEKLIDELQKLTGEKAAKKIIDQKQFEWSDNIPWKSSFTFKFKEDAEKMAEQIEALDANKDKDDGEEEVSKVKVDRRADMQGGAGVLMDKDQDIPYDVFMTKVDITYGTYGMNNFYKMQVIYQKGKDMYMLFTCWGRLGDDGQFQKTPFPSKDEAIKEFIKVFRSKSGNDWSDVKTFDNKPGKYRLVDTTPHKSKKSIKDFKFDLSSNVPSELPKPIQELLQQLTSTSILNHLLKTSCIGPMLMPYGYFSSDALLKAKGIVEKIGKMLKSIESRDNSTKVSDKTAKTIDEILDLSNEFYQLLPYDGFSHEKMTPLNSRRTLNYAQKDIENMLDLELACKIVFGAQYRIKEMNPLDYIYRSLNCKMLLLKEDSDESQMILEQISRSRDKSNIKVEAIYKIEREGEKEAQAKRLYKDCQLLWHGTKTANLISILKRGLLTMPVESAMYHGNMLGAGIYFAPAVAKSLSYCSSEGGKSKFLLLSQVALGKVHKKDFQKEIPYDKSANSCYAKGINGCNPCQYLRLQTGTSVPFGHLERRGKDGYLNYDEYVINSEQQVRMSYLVQFKP